MIETIALSVALSIALAVIVYGAYEFSRD